MLDFAQGQADARNHVAIPAMHHVQGTINVPRSHIIILQF